MSHFIYYDVTLKAVDGESFEIHRSTAAPLVGTADAADIGKRGAVEVIDDPAPSRYRFHAYPDQSLTRCPGLDRYPVDQETEWTDLRLGWRCKGSQEGFTAPAGIIPGRGGSFVEDYASPIAVRVPVEFEELCAHFSVAPLDALRQFMADACALVSNAGHPRVDRMNATSDEAVSLAAAYLSAARSNT